MYDGFAQGYAVLAPSLDDRYTLLHQCLERVAADVHPTAAPPPSHDAPLAPLASRAPSPPNSATEALAVRLAEHAMLDLAALPRLHHVTRASDSAPREAELSVLRRLWAIGTQHARAALRQGQLPALGTSFAVVSDRRVVASGQPILVRRVTRWGWGRGLNPPCCAHRRLAGGSGAQRGAAAGGSAALSGGVHRLRSWRRRPADAFRAHRRAGV
jgi:hypothetical protein